MNSVNGSSFFDEARYHAIPERNVFGVKPEPPPISKQESAPATPTMTVKLTGLIALHAKKKAILVVTHPGKPPESLLLSENEREGVIELKEIDEKGRKVRIVASGDEKVIEFDSESGKAGGSLAGLASAPAPAGPQRSASDLFNQASKAASSQTGGFISPKGEGNLASRLASMMNQITSSTPAPGGLASPFPGQTFSFDPNEAKNRPPEPPMHASEHKVSYEESVIYVEIAREMGKVMDLPPLPPTEISPEDAAEGQDPSGQPMDQGQNVPSPFPPGPFPPGPQ